jgi:hypothetical protein
MLLIDHVAGRDTAQRHTLLGESSSDEPFIVGVRVSAEHEVQGLDITQHGEEGYYWETSQP